MEYNTTRNKLVIPEYGRHVQKMVEQALTIEDREKRTKSAMGIVSIMEILNPQIREMSDYKQKLWDHLYIISDYRLDVDGPYPAPQPEEQKKRPEKPSYNTGRIRYRHYGLWIEKLIQKAILLEDGPEKELFVRSIANQMKKSYLLWNKESVTDDIIAQHLLEFSNGQLELNEEMKLQHSNELKNFVRKRPQQRQGQQKQNHGNKRNYPRYNNRGHRNSSI